jgi:hypothetical protein
MASEGRHSGVFYAMANDRVVGVTGQVEDFQICAFREQHVGDLTSTHPGHDHVSDEQVDGASCSLEISTASIPSCASSTV